MLGGLVLTGAVGWAVHTAYHAGARAGARDAHERASDVVTLGGQQEPWPEAIDHVGQTFLANVCRRENRATLVVDRASLTGLRLFAQIAKEHGEAGESPALHGRAHTVGLMLQAALDRMQPG